MEKIFGLIGGTVGHSFSKNYFDEKFFRDGLRDHHYELFPLKNISELKELIKNTKGLSGLNVTVPYKEQVIKYLNEIDNTAKDVGAVNVIKIKKDKLIGYNTDSSAFQETLHRWLPKDRSFKAMILGSGGSSKAVKQALKRMNIPFSIVSREKDKGDYTYEQVNQEKKFMEQVNLIINTTPQGMHPNTETIAPISMEYIGKEHFVYDLIYNPARTLFLQKAEMYGAIIKNGLEMLHLQAEKSWNIWNI